MAYRVRGLDPAPFRRLLADGTVAVIHAHFARRGCYGAVIERA